MDSILFDRLNSNDNVLNRFSKSVIVKEFSNRIGRKNLLEESKELIGTLAHFDTQVNVAKTFGVSQALVSDLKRGFNGSSKETFSVERNEKIQHNVNVEKKKVSELALGRLTKAIECISDDKLQDAKLGELGLVINSLGKVASLEDEHKESGDKIIFYAPRTRNEDEYAIIEVEG